MKLGVGEELIQQYVVRRHAVELGTTRALVDVTDDLRIVYGDRLPDEVYKHSLGRWELGGDMGSRLPDWPDA
jgi:hypothetical protein